MNDEELRATIEEIKAQVKAKPENAEKSEDEIDEMILDAFFKAYTEGEMSKEDLMGIAQAMGYEPTEAFEQDPEAPAQVEEGAPAAAPEAGADGVTKEDLEEVRTIDEDEDVDEFKEKIEDVKEGKGEVEEEEEEKEEDEEEVDDEDEDAQRERASKLFGTDLTKKD